MKTENIYKLSIPIVLMLVMILTLSITLMNVETKAEIINDRISNQMSENRKRKALD